MGNRLLLATLLVVGARAEAQRQPAWEVRVSDRVEVVAGAQGALSVSIAVDRGLAVSKDAPVIVDLAADPGVWMRKKRLGRGDAVDPEADAPRFAAPIKAEAAGSHAIKVRVRFWLCGGKSCRPIDVRRTATLEVTAPAPPPIDAGVGGAPADATSADAAKPSK